MEKLDAKKIIGCMIGFAGVVIINLSGNDVSMSFNLMGDGFVFISALAYAFSSVLIKKYSQTENPVMLSGYQFVAGVCWRFFQVPLPILTCIRKYVILKSTVCRKYLNSDRM